jgi:hypothetical protein
VGFVVMLLVFISFILLVSGTVKSVKAQRELYSKLWLSFVKMKVNISHAVIHLLRVTHILKAL